MEKITRFVGLDVHGETIAAAIGEGHGKVRSLGQFPNRPESVRKFIDQVGGPQGLKVCYEAGPTGYALYWQLTRMGVECDVVAPSLIPKKPGEKIKTDRRDAEKLAQCYQSGTLTSVWVPDAAHEALRDLVRARAAAKKDESRAKHRLVKYLLRYGLRHPESRRAWLHTTSPVGRIRRRCGHVLRPIASRGPASALRRTAASSVPGIATTTFPGFPSGQPCQTTPPAFADHTSSDSTQ